jgi:hypothetical protein
MEHGQGAKDEGTRKKREQRPGTHEARDLMYFSFLFSSTLFLALPSVHGLVLSLNNTIRKEMTDDENSASHCLDAGAEVNFQLENKPQRPLVAAPLKPATFPPYSFGSMQTNTLVTYNKTNY